jgi:hypothetical protein
MIYGQLTGDSLIDYFKQLKKEQKMKTQKLIVIVAIVCLLVGASGAAMAVEECASGFILNQTITDNIRPEGDCIIDNSIIEGNVRIEDNNCVIKGSVIMGNVRAVFNDDPKLVLAMDNNVVFGRVIVEGGSAAIVTNVIIKERLNDPNNRLVIENPAKNTVLKDNLIKGGNIRVVTAFTGNDYVLIEGNTVSDGDIRCPGKNNDPFGAPVDAFAINNLVPRGNITCFGQLKFGQVAQP